MQNKNTLALAEKIRFEREQTFLEDREGYRLRKEMDEDFMEFCKEFIKMPSLTKYTRITLKHGLQKFMDFLAATPRYALYKNNLKMTQLTVDMIAAYVEYLKENGTGDGPKIYFRMFKRMVTAAVDKDLIKKNPCRGFVLKNDNMTLQKEILLPEEIQQLVATHFEGERTEIHRAFIFGLYTGIRWCDTVSLTHANVDFSAKILRFNQQKTEGRSAHSGVTIPLSPTLLKLIGNPIQHTSEKIFNITCYRTTAITRLQKWVKAAGINKTITWHCARHSFAVNVLGAGANIKTVASLMGHSSIKMTEKYLHVIDQQKQDAINSLGDLDYDCEAVSL